MWIHPDLDIGMHQPAGSTLAPQGLDFLSLIFNT
jgi:hypothetical protein